MGGWNGALGRDFMKWDGTLQADNIVSTNAGEGTSTGTSGGVVFAAPNGTFQTDPVNFFWDETNNRLGLTTNAPGYTLDVGASSDLRSGTVYSGNGTVTTPSFAFSSDTDTGIMRYGANKLGFITQGSANVMVSGAELQLSGAALASNKTTAPTIIGTINSGAIFFSGGATNTVGVWLVGYSGTQVQLGTYV